MRAYKCDICETFYEQQDTPKVLISIKVYPCAAEWLDLCPKCQEKLEKFISTSRQWTATNNHTKLEGGS